MVKSYQAPTRVYKYPFEFCMMVSIYWQIIICQGRNQQAYELRFPKCKLVPQVLATEIVFEEWSEDRSRHTIERRCTLDIDAPYILKKVSKYAL